VASPARIVSLLCVVLPALASASRALAQDSALDVTTPDGVERRAATGPFAGRTLYVEPDGNAQLQAEQWWDTDPSAAEVMEKISDNPVSLWIGDWMPDARAEVDAAVTRAGEDLQVFTVYSVPQRDCGYWSAGGASGRDTYAAFIDEVALGLDGRLAILILEPDALGVLECLDEAGRRERFDMLASAVDTLTAAGGRVYIDAGDSDWVPAEEMADRLLWAGVDRAAGFALNVSHTEFSSDEAAYADEIRAIIGAEAHFVIDTSRNGLGPTEDSQWCNPLGRSHGHAPTLNLSRPGLDALLWIKRPGESDGYCNGGPDAGQWWAEHALELALTAGY
jgi:endoglucanase